MKRRTVTTPTCSRPVAPRNRAKLLFAWGLLLSALAFLLVRVQLSHRPAGEERLFLAEGVKVEALPGPPASDLSELRARLTRLAALGREALAAPDDAPKLLNYAVEAVQAGDYLSAHSALRRVIDRWHPEDPAVYDALALCAGELGIHEEWESAARQLIALSPDRIEGYGHLANLAIRRSRPEEAVRILEEAASRIPNSEVAARLELSRRFDDAMKPERAIAIAADTARAVPDDARPLLALATLQLKHGRRDAAEEALGRLEREFPRLSETQRLLAMRDADARSPKRDPKRAEHHFLRALELDASNGRALEGLGKLLVEQQRFTHAAYVLGRLLALQPGNAAARIQLAQCLSRLGDPRAEEQRRIASRLMELDERTRPLIALRNRAPSDPAPRLKLAQLSADAGRHADSLRELQAAFISSKGAQGRAKIAEFYKKIGAPVSPLAPL